MIRLMASYSCETRGIKGFRQEYAGKLSTWERKTIRQDFGMRETRNEYVRRSANETYSIYKKQEIDMVMKAGKLTVAWGHMKIKVEEDKILAWTVPEYEKKRGRERKGGGMLSE